MSYVAHRPTLYHSADADRLGNWGDDETCSSAQNGRRRQVALCCWWNMHQWKSIS